MTAYTVREFRRAARSGGIKVYRNGYVTVERQFPSGMWALSVRVGADDHLLDKVRCDDVEDAVSYFGEFCEIARKGA